jgi:transposase
LYVAFELSKETWKLAFADGLNRAPRIRDVPAATMEQLEAEVRRAQVLFGLPDDCPIVSGYEVGRDGFWLHRLLVAKGWNNSVIDPASIKVNRRKRRAKTDRLDAAAIVKALIQYQWGDRDACRVVNVPTPEDEDERQLHRELEALTPERTRHINRIKGLLIAQGFHYEVITADFATWLSTVQKENGKHMGPRLAARLVREFERLQLVVRQIRTLEREIAELLRRAAREPKGIPKWLQIADQLHDLSGLGSIGSITLSTELFSWRQFRNRRQLAAVAGLTPSPWESGSSVNEEQGISKAGRSPLRSLMVELAWGWILFQPESALTKWFRERFAEGNSVHRRTGIVALARKLLVALWRYVNEGLVPEGARFKKNPLHFNYTPSLA